MKVVDRSARWTVAAHARYVRAIHCLEVFHLFEKHVYMNNVGEVRIDKFEHRFEGLENLCGLRFNVAPSEEAC